MTSTPLFPPPYSKGKLVKIHINNAAEQNASKASLLKENKKKFENKYLKCV